MNFKKYGYICLILILIFTAQGLKILYKQIDSKITPVEVNGNIIKIMSKEYDVNDIDNIELLDEVSISGGTGSNTPNTNNGRYKVNDDKFESRVYIHKNVSPFIKIKVKDNTIIFNENISDKTEELYKNIVQLKNDN